MNIKINSIKGLKILIKRMSIKLKYIYSKLGWKDEIENKQNFYKTVKSKNLNKKIRTKVEKPTTKKTKL